MSLNPRRRTSADLKFLIIASCGFVLTAALTTRSAAAPSPFGFNHYEYIQVSNPFSGNNNSWSNAQSAAAARTFLGVNGHLATITSQAENNFVFSLTPGSFSGFTGAWLGGKQPEGWLTGPESSQAFGFTNWGGPEPNNAGYAYMNIGTTFAGIAPGRWADDSGTQGVPDPSNDPVVGYFVEYEHTVPEPTGLLLILTGLVGIGLRKRRRGVVTIGCLCVSA